MNINISNKRSASVLLPPVQRYMKEVPSDCCQRSLLLPDDSSKRWRWCLEDSQSNWKKLCIVSAQDKTEIYILVSLCITSKKLVSVGQCIESVSKWKCLFTSGQAQGSGKVLSLFLLTLRSLRDFKQCMTAVGRLVRQLSDTSSSSSLRRPIQLVAVREELNNTDKLDIKTSVNYHK